MKTLILSLVILTAVCMAQTTPIIPVMEDGAVTWGNSTVFAGYYEWPDRAPLVRWANAGLLSDEPDHRRLTCDSSTSTFTSGNWAYSWTALPDDVQVKFVLYKRPVAAIYSISQTAPVTVTTKTAHGLSTGAKVWLTSVPQSMQLVAKAWTITVTGATTFTLNGAVAVGETARNGVDMSATVYLDDSGSVAPAPIKPWNQDRYQTYYTYGWSITNNIATFKVSRKPGGVDPVALTDCGTGPAYFGMSFAGYTTHIYMNPWSGVPVTIDPATDTLTRADSGVHGYSDTSKVSFTISPGGTVPTTTVPMHFQVTGYPSRWYAYCVVKVDDYKFKLKNFVSNNTCASTTIDFQNAGSGQMYVTACPHCVGSIYTRSDGYPQGTTLRFSDEASTSNSNALLTPHSANVYTSPRNGFQTGFQGEFIKVPATTAAQAYNVNLYVTANTTDPLPGTPSAVLPLKVVSLTAPVTAGPCPSGTSCPGGSRYPDLPGLQSPGVDAAAYNWEGLMVDTRHGGQASLAMDGTVESRCANRHDATAPLGLSVPTRPQGALTVPVVDAVNVSNTMTITTTDPISLSVNDAIVINGSESSQLNRSFRVNTVISSTSFQINVYGFYPAIPDGTFHPVSVTKAAAKYSATYAWSTTMTVTHNFGTQTGLIEKCLESGGASRWIEDAVVSSRTDNSSTFTFSNSYQPFCFVAKAAELTADNYPAPIKYLITDPGHYWFYHRMTGFNTAMYRKAKGDSDWASWGNCSLAVASIWMDYANRKTSSAAYYHGSDVLTGAFGWTGEGKYKWAALRNTNRGIAVESNGDGWPLEYGVREHFWSMDTRMLAEDLSGIEDTALQDWATVGLGHVWNNVTKQPERQFTEPFMVGFGMRGLIEWYRRSHDARVPYVLKLAVDQYWNDLLNWTDAQGNKAHPEFTNGASPAPAWFVIYNPEPSGARCDIITAACYPGATDVQLNAFAAPAFFWYWRLTGNDLYRQRGDQVFAHSFGTVAPYWSKTFSQLYYWTWEGVDWRLGKRPAY